MTVVARRSSPADGLCDDHALIHAYALSTDREPRPGDVSLCGHVKQVPHDGVEYTEASCVVCAELEAAWF